MKRRHFTGVVCLALTAQLSLGFGLSSLRGNVATVGSLNVVESNETATEIKAKWDKMDEFLKIMFQIACKWKHGADVRGEVREKLTDGEIGRNEVADTKAQLQARNVQDMKQACGRITATFKEKCRTGCGDRWNEAMEKRSECDGKCVKVYDKFESTCDDKSANLGEVYEMSLKDAAARKQCHEGYCSAFPTVWMKTDKAEMEAERDKGCEGKCTEKSIKLACQRQWQLQADFVGDKVASACFEKGTTKACFDGKKETASQKQETCSSGGKTGCTTQYDECVTAGKTDESHPDAGAFCTERKKMCQSQVVEGCLAEHKSALDAAQKSCETADAATQTVCKEEAMAAKQEAASDKCIAEKTPACTANCNKKCDVGALDGCLANLKSEYDPTTEFCGEVWHLLQKSSEIDPVTGDPIVFLVSKK